jgi:hypothetical protein
MTDTFRNLCAEHLPELRGMFERILCVARSSDGFAVGNIQLADRLINAVVSWSENSLAQPEPVAPTVMEIIELHSWLEDEWRANNDGEDLPMLDYARAVLARWGTPAIQPVPVSERLPGPGLPISTNALPTPEATND